MPSDSFPDLLPERFSDATPGGTSRSSAVGRLERLALAAARDAAVAAAEAFIASLNAQGHAFERDESIAPFAFRSTLDGERILVLEWLIGAAAQARVIAPHELSPTGILSPAEQAFYAALERVRAREADVGYRKLAARERLVLCLGNFEAEVNNGGFSQFFLNSSGDHAADTLKALEKIGARKGAAMLAEAMALFPGGAPPPDRDVRGALLLEIAQSHGEALSALDARYQRSPELIPFLAERHLP